MQHRSREARPYVAVVGMGKIGLPLAMQFVQHGRRVIGCDINPRVVDMINAGQTPVREEVELVAGVSSAVASGASVYVDDPLYSQAEVRAMGYTPIAPGHEDEIRAIIVQAGHRVYQEFDFSRFPRCRVVLDGRRAHDRQRIEASGMRYIAIGDGAQREQQQEAEQEVQRSVSTVGGQC